MPVPPRRHARMHLPHDQMCRTRVNLLITAGTAVWLGGRGAGHLANRPVTIRPLLDPLGAQRRARCGGPRSPGLARTHAINPIGVLIPAVSHYSDVPCDLLSPGAASTTTVGSPLTCPPPCGCSS